MIRGDSHERRRLNEYTKQIALLRLNRLPIFDPIDKVVEQADADPHGTARHRILDTRRDGRLEQVHRHLKKLTRWN
jgi:hypothetical protein